MQDSVCRETVTVNLPDGLHLRPISLIAKLTRQYSCEVRMFKGDHGVDAKNILEAMTLVAPCGTTLVLEATGEKACDVVKELVRLFESNFAVDDEPAEPAAG